MSEMKKKIWMFEKSHSNNNYEIQVAFSMDNDSNRNTS